MTDVILFVVIVAFFAAAAALLVPALSRLTAASVADDADFDADADAGPHSDIEARP